IASDGSLPRPIATAAEVNEYSTCSHCPLTTTSCSARRSGSAADWTTPSMPYSIHRTGSFPSPSGSADTETEQASRAGISQRISARRSRTRPSSCANTASIAARLDSGCRTCTSTRSYGNTRAPRPAGCAFLSTSSSAAWSNSSGSASSPIGASKNPRTRAWILRAVSRKRPVTGISSLDQSKLARRRDNRAGDRRGRASAIAGVLDDDGKGDAALSAVRRKAGEPGVRRRAGNLRGARLAGNRDGVSAQALAGARRDDRAHRARQALGVTSRQEPRFRRDGRRARIPAHRDDGATRRDGGGDPGELERRDERLPLAVTDLRQHRLQRRRRRRARHTDLEERRGVEDRLWTDRLRQLCEVGVARHDEAAIEIHVAVRLRVHRIVTHGARHAADVVADT